MVFAEILVPQTDERSEYDAVEKKFAEFAARSEKEGISFTNQSPYRFERHE